MIIMRHILATALFTLLLGTSNLVAAKDLRFAVISKEENNPFFLASRDGCLAAAQELEGIQCVFRGPPNIDVRKQDRIIEQLIEEGVDGIAVAVSQSEFLASNSIHKAIKLGIPVITYDADFSKESLEAQPNLRTSYIGTNDFELGKALGEQLKSHLPNGGNIIIQSGRPDSPNLNLRVMGVRAALSGKTYTDSPGEQLTGENGWKEFSKPLYNFGQFDRAQRDLKNVLASHKRKNIAAVVAVGGWTQFLPSYRTIVEPYQEAIANKEFIIITADTADEQLVYLKDNLAHGNIGQNPHEMGRQAILTLYKLVNKQPVSEVVHIPMTYCTPENFSTCTKN